MSNWWDSDAWSAVITVAGALGGSLIGGWLVARQSSTDAERAAGRAKRDRLATATEVIYVQLEERRYDLSMAVLDTIQVLTPNGTFASRDAAPTDLSDLRTAHVEFFRAARRGRLYFSDSVNDLLVTIGVQLTSLLRLLQSDPGHTFADDDDSVQLAAAAVVNRLGELSTAMRADVRADA